ncbi:MAG: alanine--tRNA ligase [Thermoplasmata archaeon]
MNGGKERMPQGDMSVELNFFRERGFERRQCSSCGSAFWSPGGSRALCGDTPCVEYSFIGAPKMREKHDLASMRELYLSFFEKRGHTRISRYPVVARWRDDVFLVNASIYDFQPHVTSGEVPPPANPLTISQPCIRLVDLDSVGRSGRHLSNFEMMAHHAFNTKERRVYWKEECVAYCHELLTEELGVPEDEITYKENPWTGGGNAGSALEVMVGGLELATLVFMDLRLDPRGPVVLDGQRYGPMPLSVVDTGYGLERFVWVSRGTPTIYDAIYPGVLKELFELSGVSPPEKCAHPEVLAEHARLAGMMSVSTTSRLLEQRKGLLERLRGRGINLSLQELVELLEPIEKVFTLADHTRCILLMLADGIVPSNVKAGYLARLVIRKALRVMEELGLETPLADLVFMHRKTTEGVLKIVGTEEVIRTMLELETKRYRDTSEKGARMVRRLARECGGGITLEKLIELYDTHGIHPSVVQAAAAEVGVSVEVPDAFSALVAQRHSAEQAREERGPALPEGIPPTRALYYEQPALRSFEAVVLFSRSSGGREEVVLDATAFYPEGGGQHADKGWIEAVDAHGRPGGGEAAMGGALQQEGSGPRKGGEREGVKVRATVMDVQKVDGRIIHVLEPPLGLREGERVRGEVDWRVRMAHSRHHTATHIIIGSARRVLGPHVWQAGAEKGESGAHVDISHYDRVTMEQLHEIERVANEVVAANLPVELLELPREEAEKRYGFLLYQGGAPTGRVIRVVRIGDFDSQACGGTHTRTSGEAGLIKITRAERIQDGVVRLEYSASLAALARIQHMERLLHEASNELSVPPEQLPKSARRFFEEWKALRKEVQALRTRTAREMAERRRPLAERVGEFSLVAISEEVDTELARELATALAGDPRTVCAVSSKLEGTLVLAAGGEVPLRMGELARELAGRLGASGGGRDRLAQLGGISAERAEEAARAAAELLQARLSGK